MSRSLRYLLGAVVAVYVSSGPAAGHMGGSADGFSWLLWGKVSALAIGAGCVAVGIYLDQNREQRSRYVDYLIITGFLLGIGGGLGLYN